MQTFFPHHLIIDVALSNAKESFKKNDYQIGAITPIFRLKFLKKAHCAVNYLPRKSNKARVYIDFLLK